MRKPNAATLIASAALVVAVTGTDSIANAAKLITGKQIKNGSIQRIDLAAGVRAKLDAAGTPGPIGPAGPAGPTGASGPAGQARAYGYVTSAGLLDTARANRGIVSVRYLHPTDESVYCVKLDPSIPQATTSPMLTIEFENSTTNHPPASNGDHQQILEWDRAPNTCDAAQNELEIRAYAQSFAGGALVGQITSSTGFSILVP